MLALLDWQHTGKPDPTKVDDLGAAADIDGDGRIHDDETEAHLTGYILLAAASRMRELGHHVICVCDGWYGDRHLRANRYVREGWHGERAAYVALHLNAADPAGGYGLVGYDYRSVRGAALADDIGTCLRDMADELTAVKVRSARPDDWTRGMYACIAGTSMPAICYEPAFITQPMHGPLLQTQGLRRLGLALAEGLHRWGSQ